jgi:hypothetical protein
VDRVVAAESNSLADLEEAKRKARQIDEQLESEIGPNKARPTGAKQGSIEDQPDPESSA